MLSHTPPRPNLGLVAVEDTGGTSAAASTRTPPSGRPRPRRIFTRETFTPPNLNSERWLISSTSCGTSKMRLSERSSSRRLSSKAQPWQLGWMSRGPRAEAPPLRGIFLAQMGSLRAHSSTPTTIDSTSHMIVLTRSARWRTRLLPAAGAALWGSLCEFLRAWPLPIEVLQCLSFSLPCSAGSLLCGPASRSVCVARFSFPQKRRRQDTRANRTRHTSSSSTRPHAEHRHTKAHTHQTERFTPGPQFQKIGLRTQLRGKRAPETLHSRTRTYYMHSILMSAVTAGATVRPCVSVAMGLNQSEAHRSHRSFEWVASGVCRDGIRREHIA